MQETQPKYFIVKHDLESLEALPNFIWNTGEGHHPSIPRGYHQIKKGDRWIAYAYANNFAGERPLRSITGFYECTKEARYRRIPKAGIKVAGGNAKAWMIKGMPLKWMVRRPASIHPVSVEPIAELLDESVFNQQAILKINRKKFDEIRKRVMRDQFNPNDIPLLKREPRGEQEVLAVVVAGQQRLGIDKFNRVRTAFPDLLVTLKGRHEPVHLEVETYSSSFLLHRHNMHIRKGKFKTDKPEEEKPVAILCWIDDDKKRRLLKKYVHKVYELRELLRKKKPILW